jgi:transposase
MVTPRRKKYRPWTPSAYAHQTYTPADRLPEGDLVFFLLDLVSQLDLEPFYACHEQETRGQPPFDPALLVCLLLYAYSVGVYSSRKIALACERNLALLAIVGDDRPDFRTISDFRKDHLHAFADLFAQVLRLAATAGLLRLGNLAFDGSKLLGQASRHKAMSYGYMKKEEVRLRQEIEALRSS